MKVFLTLVLHVSFFLTPVYFCFSQNICPNPGFEQISACPAGAGELNLASPWNGAGVPADLFNFCHVNGPIPGCDDMNVPNNFAGISAAHGGSSYAGFYTKRAAANQRTYLQAPITPMITNQVYRVSAFFRRSSASRFATNNIAISFSTSAISQVGGAFIAVTPQLQLMAVVADTGNWTAFTSYYTAAGGEAWITIGNFKNDAGTTSFNFSTPSASCIELNSSAFYYTDDISIVPITEQLSVSGDTTICIGESTTLTGVTNTEGWWSLLSAPADTLPSINNSITVAPIVNTTYVWNGVQTSVSTTVNAGPAPEIILPNDTSICDGTTFTLDAGNPGSEYLWSTGELTQTISVADSGTYVVTVSNEFCSAKDTFNLSIKNSPEINLPQSSTICPDNSEFITLDGGPGETYLWSPGADTTRTLLVTTGGVYVVTVTHSNGCTRAGFCTVNEVCSETLFFPGAFTPNNDGKNDSFYGDGTNFIDYQIKIFNRWGQLVYESKIPGLAGAWNGRYNDKPAPAGIYTYVVSYAALKSAGKKKILKKEGNFTLIR